MLLLLHRIIAVHVIGLLPIRHLQSVQNFTYLLTLLTYCVLQVLDGMGISSEKLNIDMFDLIKVRQYSGDGLLWSELSC